MNSIKKKKSNSGRKTSNEETDARVQMIGKGRQQLMLSYGPSKIQILTAPSQYQWSISHGAFQPQAVPASQCLGDVTHTGIGCLFGSAPQNDSVLYAPFGSDHNSSALSPQTPKQRGRCLFGWHKWLSYRAQMSQCSRLDPYILYQLAVNMSIHPWQLQESVTASN